MEPNLSLCRFSPLRLSPTWPNAQFCQRWVFRHHGFQYAIYLSRPHQDQGHWGAVNLTQPLAIQTRNCPTVVLWAALICRESWLLLFLKNKSNLWTTIKGSALSQDNFQQKLPQTWSCISLEDLPYPPDSYHSVLSRDWVQNSFTFAVGFEFLKNFQA